MQHNVQQEKKSQLEISLEKLSQHTSSFVQQTSNFMEETRTNFKNQEASIRSLETQMGQISKQLAERPPGRFPSDTVVNPKEYCKVITLRSGKTVSSSERSARLPKYRKRKT